MIFKEFRKRKKWDKLLALTKLTKTLKKTQLNTFYIIFIFHLFGCVNDSLDTLKNEQFASQIIIKWNQAYQDETIENAELGLKWAFSHIGAHLPKAKLNLGLYNNNDLIFIDIDELGFDATAIQNLGLLHKRIKESEEYQVKGNIDLGRYVSLLIGSSEHYYAITGVPLSFDEFVAPYQLQSLTGYINNSFIARQHRIVQYSNLKGLNQVFVSYEIDSVSGLIKEIEAFDLMPNGQPRFGIYDAQGKRMSSTQPEFTEAGKPAKCMWCHESSIQPLFGKQNDLSGYLSAQKLADTLSFFRNTLIDKQIALPKGIDYSEKQDHTQMELLYITFMEPSVERLTVEWNLSTDEVLEMLKDQPTHHNEEFPFLGELYDRKDIEKLAPIKGLEISSSVREASEIEVNHIF